MFLIVSITVEGIWCNLPGFIANQAGAYTITMNFTILIRLDDGFLFLVYKHMSLTANVSQRAWFNGPIFLLAHGSSTLPK